MTIESDARMVAASTGAAGGVVLVYSSDLYSSTKQVDKIVVHLRSIEYDSNSWNVVSHVS